MRTAIDEKVPIYRSNRAGTSQKQSAKLRSPREVSKLRELVEKAQKAFALWTNRVGRLTRQSPASPLKKVSTLRQSGRLVEIALNAEVEVYPDRHLTPDRLQAILAKHVPFPGKPGKPGKRGTRHNAIFYIRPSKSMDLKGDLERCLEEIEASGQLGIFKRLKNIYTVDRAGVTLGKTEERLKEKAKTGKVSEEELKAIAEDLSNP